MEKYFILLLIRRKNKYVWVRGIYFIVIDLNKFNFLYFLKELAIYINIDEA